MKSILLILQVDFSCTICLSPQPRWMELHSDINKYMPYAGSKLIWQTNAMVSKCVYLDPLSLQGLCYFFIWFIFIFSCPVLSLVFVSVFFFFFFAVIISSVLPFVLSSHCSLSAVLWATYPSERRHLYVTSPAYDQSLKIFLYESAFHLSVPSSLFFSFYTHID